MKKFGIAALVVCPLGISVLCRAASGEEMPARVIFGESGCVVPHDRHITSEALVGDQLYNLDGNSGEILLYDLQNASGALESCEALTITERQGDKICFRFPIYIFERSDQLYAIEASYIRENGRNSVADLGLYQLSLENGYSDALVCALPFEKMIAYDQYHEYISSIADADFLPEDGRLVLVYYAGEGTVCNVIRLSDSSVETMQYDDISEVLFLEDGSMLLYRIEGDAGNVYRLDENHREELLFSLPGEAKGLAHSRA